ncbi:hypothetical protein GALMADRAFT_133645 [Galerina marginata CBS 339.88]|uniref:Uncharacterized protein n=1 Tax=Galerina marginata (strain CBS 339.88) TaxID=685588 RepID=A0A067TPQ7_GALM3|nr:hypothetical protein GALMADRAFT_133645 [Galerina marginata CBS 339.88]
MPAIAKLSLFIALALMLVGSGALPVPVPENTTATSKGDFDAGFLARRQGSLTDIIGSYSGSLGEALAGVL